MKITTLPTFIILSSLSLSSFAQKVTNDQTKEFAISKISYVDSCIDTYDESEQTCDCTFEYMRNNYKVRFYQDDAFLNDDHQQRHQLLEKMTESLHVCSSIERDEFAYPRIFDE